jgi:hypothetical protein
MSAQATEMGPYTVNSDCTGTYTVQINPIGFSSQAFFAIDSNGDEVKIIVTDPGSVITCVAKKLFQEEPFESPTRSIRVSLPSLLKRCGAVAFAPTPRFLASPGRFLRMWPLNSAFLDIGLPWGPAWGS